MLQEWSGNIETKVSMHFINEFVSLLDPNMKKGFDWLQIWEFQEVSEFVQANHTSCLVISVAEQPIRLKWCTDIFLV